MTNKPPDTQIGDNRNYNCSRGPGGTNRPGLGKIDVVIPPHLVEFGPGAARALLHLLVEAHHKRTMTNEQSVEDT
jgi:hypothetical protein